LETAVNNLGKHILDPSNMSERRDSGAIMVGAAQATPSEAYRMTTSNYGDRVNCFAWGNLVTTTTDSANGYTAAFSGTSSASAIVAGAAIVAQGLAEQNLGYRFGSFQLRDLLIRTGTVPNNRASQKIGVMPNLQAFIGNVLYLTPDVFVRDYIGDNGDPHIGAIWASPDVIVRPEGSVADPNTTFGGSATFNDNTLGSLIIGGQNHVVYVRVMNRGGSAATGTKATVYWAYPSTLVTPNTWTKIGTSANPITVPVSTTFLTVLDPIPWPAAAIPGSGNYSFIATIGSDHDPDPIPNPADLMRQPPNVFNFDDFQNIIRRNNNVTWSNFHVVTMLTGAQTMELPFRAQGWPNEDLPMQLEVVARLPEGSGIWLAGPSGFMNMIVENTFYLKEGPEAGVLRLPINPYGVNRLKEVVFPAKLQADMRVLVDVPKERRENTYEVFARQLYHNEEVGRVIWRLTPSDRVKPSRLRFVLDKCCTLRSLPWWAWFVLGVASAIIAIRNCTGRKKIWHIRSSQTVESSRSGMP
jgi:hypothetical protein